MESLPSSYVTEKAKRVSASPWIWLLEIPFPEFNEALRVAVNTKAVTWPSAGGKVFYPYDLRVGETRQGGDDIGGGSLSVETRHADLQLKNRFTARRGFIDRDAIVRYVHADHLDEASIPESRYEVSVVIQDSGAGIRWQLGALRLFSRSSPRRKYSPSFCAWVYGSRIGCAFNTSRPGAPQTCDHTLEGDNGCRAHGDWEQQNGYPILHPERIGLFPFVALHRN